MQRSGDLRTGAAVVVGRPRPGWELKLCDSNSQLCIYLIYMHDFLVCECL